MATNLALGWYAVSSVFLAGCWWRDRKVARVEREYTARHRKMESA